MIYFFKLLKYLLIFSISGLIFVSCISDYDSDSVFPPYYEQLIIKEILEENNISVDYLRDKLLIEYFDWPNDDKEKGYTILFDDTSIHTINLTTTINNLQNSTFFNGINICYRVGGAIIDSINIITDSVIIIPSLDLSYCNLKNLPAQIKKIRVRNLNIRDNHSTLETLPDEMMQLSEPPFYWDTLLIEYDIRIVEKMDSVSDTLKSWLRSHSAISY